MKLQQPFPKDFLWGASTASHQVEGGTTNQWSVWELANAAELAKSAEKKYGSLPNWAEIKARAENPDNYVSGAGVEHYERYQQDFDLLEQMNLNSFRFGIEWSRLEPSEGTWDEAEIKHYHDYIDDLIRRGIEPVLNVWHWTMPTWLTDLDGLTKKSNLKYFDRFMQKVATEYGSKLKYVITINEPNVYMSFGYLIGEWPPQEKKPLRALRVCWNLTRVHRSAYAIFKATSPDTQVGIALNLVNMQAERQHAFFSLVATKVMRYAWNWWFLNRIKKYQDFVGINYYFTDYYSALTRVRRTIKPRIDHEERVENAVPLLQRENPSAPLSDVGTYMEPEGLYDLLLRTWQRYGKPIIISENGLADEHDDYRQWWIEETIMAMQRAQSRGVIIKGYMHWSLLDNFEWAFGWWPKFGLVDVDREHDMKRTIRPSGRWYGQQVAAMRGIEAKPSVKNQTVEPVAPDPVKAKNAGIKPQPITKETDITARYKIPRAN